MADLTKKDVQEVVTQAVAGLATKEDVAQTRWAVDASEGRVLAAVEDMARITNKGFEDVDARFTKLEQNVSSRVERLERRVDRLEAA